MAIFLQRVSMRLCVKHVTNWSGRRLRRSNVRPFRSPYRARM